MNKHQHDKAPAKKVSRQRRWMFRIIALLIPFLLIGITEGLLRTFNYGYDPSVFIDYPADNNYLILNPAASKKYFLDQAIATTGNMEPFKKEKDSNTTRIFVLGESTTIGYPYFHNGSFHRWLQYRLMHSVPGRNFEIINLSLTAVNSYTVLGFAKECAKYQPDAVLIYTGHNEYYGALGVGSTATINGSPYLVNTILVLRQLRFVQWMTNVYQSIRSSAHGEQDHAGKTRMELMVAQQQIPYGSELYNRGVRQFITNLDEILRLFNKKNIPVFVSNLVSNEKDLKPFIDGQSDSLQLPAFSNNYTAGLNAFNQGDSGKATNFFLAANKAYPAHASCNYYLGRLALGSGDTAAAKAYLAKARDLDALRFRAPAQLNTVIAQTCSKYPNAHLIDTKALYEAQSKQHIIGEELILEHVHPNLLGYALLSDAFYQAIKKENLIILPASQEMSFAQLLQQMPITTMDSLTGAYRIAHLKKNWPFNDKATPVPDSTAFHSEEERLAYGIAFQQLSWADATQELYATYIKAHNLAKAKTLVETLVLEHPAEETYYTSAANICGELKDYNNALFYFRKSFELAPSFDKARFLFVMNFMIDQPAAAMPYLDYAINSGNASLNPIKVLANDIIRLQQNELAKDSANLPALNAIAGKYLKMGNKEGVQKYVQKVLNIDHNNKEAQAIWEQVKQ